MNFFSKEFLFGTLSFLVLATAVLLIYSVFWGPIANYSSSLLPARTLSVSASDKVTVKPDVAFLSFSVVKEGSKIEKIIEEGNQTVNQAIEFLKSSGIEEKDIKTTEYNLSPVYSSPSKWGEEFIPRIVKYSFTQTVSVKVRDFKKISSILEKLPQLGINRIGDLSFGIDEPEVFLSQAREKAFQKAKEKAEKIASQNGLKLGRIISLSDYSGNYYPVPMGRGGADKLESAALSVAPSIEPGSQEVSVNVSVIYEIK
ncbi:MAG: SIMPL domain-containing protein [Patescibacteria group bacterium]|nr:SIMPL domain-containing protein [Patescibacteria group bacterium]